MNLPAAAINAGADALLAWDTSIVEDQDVARAVLSAATTEIECPRCKGKGKVRDLSSWQGGLYQRDTLPVIDCPQSGCRGEGRLFVLKTENA